MPAASPSNSPRYVFLNSRFPCLSETFVFDQLARLQQLGLPFDIVSNHRPANTEVHPHMQAMQAQTCYLQDTSAVRLLQAVAWLLYRHPWRTLRALRRVMQLDEPVATSLAHLLGAATVLFQVRGQTVHFHAHFTYGGAAVAWWCWWLAEVPYSLTLHGSDVLFDNPPDLARKLIDASALISISQYNLDTLARSQPALRIARSAVISLGVVTQPRQAPPLRPSQSVLRILNVGRLSEHKAQHVLIEACAQLKTQGIQFRCQIVGTGPKEAALRQRIAALDLQDCVALLGPRFHEQVLQLYRQHDVYVSTSVIEGMPIVLMEAMNACVPIVATAVGAVPELLGDGALLVPEGDASAVARAIARIARAEVASTDLTARAHARLSAHFDAARNHARMAEFLRTLPSGTV